MSSAPRFVVDEDGNRIEVVIKIAEYRRMLEALEEVASLHAYDAAKASGDEAIPFEAALQEIEREASRTR